MQELAEKNGSQNGGIDWDAEVDHYRQKQESQLVIDVDQAIEEEKSKAIKIKLNGKIYKASSNLPAWVFVFLQRHGKGKENELSDEDSLEFISRLLGDEIVEQIADESNNFLSLDVITKKVLIPVMHQWGLGKAKATEDDKKKPMTPES